MGRTKFQYPLFRIELLSWAIWFLIFLLAWVSISALSDRIAQLGEFVDSVTKRLVSISALSDRIAQPAAAAILFAGEYVSISALSDRIAQPGGGLAGQRRGAKFQYPLFRIELLSERIAGQTFDSACFNIRSFGSNCSAMAVENHSTGTRVSISALSDRIAQPFAAGNGTVHPSTVSISALSDRIAQRIDHASLCTRSMLFQYPLFRIELLSGLDFAGADEEAGFQYPLFRIELLSATSP